MRNRTIGRLLAGVACSLGLAAAGCGGGNPDMPELVPAGGKVTMDGTPLAGAQVTFVPAGATPGNDAGGRTDEEGRYEIESRHGTGAPVGQYRVVITKLVMPDGSDFIPTEDVSPMDSPARQVLPAQYSDADRTVLEATVPEGGSDGLDFALEGGGDNTGMSP